MSRNPELAVRRLGSRYLERHPHEAAAGLEHLDPEDVVSILEPLPDQVLVSLVAELSSYHAREIALRLSQETRARFLRAVDPSYAARLLSGFEPAWRDQVLEGLPPKLAEEVRTLISYPEEVAGSIMEARFLALRPETTVEDALSVLRGASSRPREQIFVLDSDDRFLGRVGLANLAIAPPEQSLRELLEPVLATIQAMAPKEEVMDLLREYHLTSLPVLDAEGRLLGVIRQDALITASRAEVMADLQSMVGASRDERALSKASFAVRKRLPWLEVNLLTAFLAAAVVGFFEDTIARVTALAVLLPVVAGQSGNTGAQALAVTMRGLALREVRPRQWPRVLFKEVRVGFVNGIAVALTTSIFVYLWSRSLPLSLVIGISMVLSMTIAGFAGGAIPLILSAMRQDPAQSSSIFLTTVTDVAGFFSFLGIATLFLSRL